MGKEGTHQRVAEGQSERLVVHTFGFRLGAQPIEKVEEVVLDQLLPDLLLLCCIKGAQCAKPLKVKAPLGVGKGKTPEVKLQAGRKAHRVEFAQIGTQHLFRPCNVLCFSCDQRHKGGEPGIV